jgi:UPF0716 protein FxsA
MVLLLALIFLALPIAELAVIVTVASSIGVVNAIGLLVLVSFVGAWLAKREGLGMLTRIRDSLDRGELPSREVADGFLILLAGALMITPGFITDCLALVLLFPPSRAVIRSTLLRSALRRGRVTLVSGRRGPGRYDRNRRGGNGHDGGVWDAESWEAPPRGRDELGGAR